MHPVLARFLDLRTALAALDRIERPDAASPEAPLSDDERALAKVLHRSPEQRTALAGARGRAHPDERAQQALVYLAANAAIERLREDPDATAALTRADLSLRAHGASDAQVAGMLATVLVEEAFGYDDEVDDFDLPFVVETLEALPALAALDPDRVEAVREALLQAAPAPRRDAAGRAFDTLVETAWGEGPEPLNPEHALAARAALDDAAKAELPPALRALAEAGFVGPRRLSRLLDRLEAAREAD